MVKAVVICEKTNVGKSMASKKRCFFGVSKNRLLAKYLFPGNALNKDRKSCASNMFLHVGDCIFINTSRLHIGKHFCLKLSKTF